MKTLTPVILSAAHLPRANEKLPLSGVRTTYLQKCSKHGYLPLIVSPTMSAEIVDALYDMAWGLLLIGGADIAPALYGEAAHNETLVTEPERDVFEIELFQRAFRESKPILGICRGCQVIAVAAGGTLVQHVPEIVSSEIHARPYEAQLDSPSHRILIRKDSRLAQIVGVEEGLVTSAHHQAVKAAPAGFCISAKSPEGIVEAIELENSTQFCIGLQAHPETEENGLLEPVFAAFRQSMIDWNAQT